MARRTIDIEDYRDITGHDGLIYEFMSERGLQALSYAEYLADTELRAMVNDLSRYRLVLGRRIFTYTMEFLRNKPQIRQMLKDFEHEQQLNPLRFFAPSGNAMCNFINDFDNSLCILTAANRVGKTQHMFIKKLINNMPCDPNWEIFTKYGVKYRPFRGGRELALATYDLPFHRTTSLPMLLRWLPKAELGPFAKDYKGKGSKQVNMNNVPILPLTCGTNIHFAAMTQGQSPFEGNIKHDWGWDEQGTEAAFIGADARITEILDGRHDFGMTPHKIDGRPDTGAGSWINKVHSGENTYGHTVGLHQAQVWDAPDWYLPEKNKTKEFEKWVIEPTKNHDEKRKREGQARFFGKWHESSGLVIDEWDSTKHVIEPFEIPKHWTRYRALDHGDKHPAACLWGAVSPAGDLFIYRDWLRTGLVVSQIAKEVIEASGNERKKIGSYMNPKTEQLHNKFTEVQTKERYPWTVFDSRAFSHRTKDSGLLLHKLYDDNGLKVKKASGHDSDHYVPILKEWFTLDFDKEHFVTGVEGAPRVYVFATCGDFIKTIKRWVWTERKTKSSERLAKESPTKVDDDLMDCMKYMIQAGPKFRGDAQIGDSKYYKFLDDFEDEDAPVAFKPMNSWTGY